MRRAICISADQGNGRIPNRVASWIIRPSWAAPQRRQPTPMSHQHIRRDWARGENLPLQATSDSIGPDGIYVMDFYPVGLGTSIIWRVMSMARLLLSAPITGSVGRSDRAFADPNLLLGKLVTRTVRPSQEPARATMPAVDCWTLAATSVGIIGPPFGPSLQRVVPAGIKTDTPAMFTFQTTVRTSFVRSTPPAS